MPTSADTVTIAGYSHVNLMVDDLDAAMDFYCNRLGFAVLPRPDFGPGAWLGKGSAQVHLGVVDEMAPRVGFPHVAFHIPTAAFAATVAALEEQDVAFVMGPSSREDFGVPVQTAFIQDPAGNIIELTDVDPG